MIYDDDDDLSSRPICHTWLSLLFYISLERYSAGVFLYKLWEPKGFLQFEIIINVLVSFFRFI